MTGPSPGAVTPTVQALSRAMPRVAQAFQPVGDRLWAEACRAYRQHHRRLPGSERTRRLRQKRQQRVLSWWLRLGLQPRGVKAGRRVDGKL